MTREQVIAAAGCCATADINDCANCPFQCHTKTGCTELFAKFIVLDTSPSDLTPYLAAAAILVTGDKWNKYEDGEIVSQPTAEKVTDCARALRTAALEVPRG